MTTVLIAVARFEFISLIPILARIAVAAANIAESTAGRIQFIDIVYTVYMEPTCPKCHVVVRATDFFCFNCGRNLHDAGLSTSIGTQALYYIGSLLLPPIGIFWGIKYLREPNESARRIGIACIVLTVISVIVLCVQIITAYNSVSGFVQNQSSALEQLR